MTMPDTQPQVTKLRRILITIVLATLPLYLIGLVVLWVGSAAKNLRTPTPEISTVIVTATPAPSATLPPPTAFPTLTPTHTAMPTPTHTATPPPTLTPLPTETVLPTETPTELPTATFTTEPVISETPTEITATP